MTRANLPLIAFAVALGCALWRAVPPAAPLFAPAAPTPAASPEPAFVHRTPLPVAAASAHAASLVELADGRIACAWFAGSREGAADVAIRWSTWDGHQWSPARVVLDRQQVASATGTHVRKLGNPVLARIGPRLHLWVVSVGVGGWAGSAINHLRSEDDGLTWSAPQRLVSSPLFNLSTLVRTPPIALTDGGFGLPVYHEFLAKHGEWLRFGANGQLLDKTRMAQAVPALQPATVALDETQAIALLRDAGPAPGQVRVALSSNGGQTWQARPPLALGNPNASIALIRLHSGALLLAANPIEGRQSLQLWLSRDDGAHWQLARTIEQAATVDAEFSYPSLLQARDGTIHLAYTRYRTGIHHAAFNERWLKGEQP